MKNYPPRHMGPKLVLLGLIGHLLCISARAQLYVSPNAVLHLQDASIIVQGGDIELHAPVSGSGQGSLMLNGVTPQHITSNGQGIYGLEVNHSSQVNLNDDATILHQLTLTQGKIKTGNQTVSIPAGATVYRTLGWVDGRMQKHVSAGSQVTLTFEIGDSLFYTPVQFTFDSVTTPGDVRLSTGTPASAAPNYATNPLNTSNYINRYWVADTVNTLVFTNANATLNYVQADEIGNPTTWMYAKYDTTWNTGTTTGSGTQSNLSGLKSLGTILLGVSKALEINCFLQGYYLGNQLQTAALANQGENSTPNASDTLTVSLHDANTLNLVHSSRIILNQNGVSFFTLPATISGPHYLRIQHRNHIETWSAQPISIGSLSHYGFQSSASQAYGSNQVEVEPGVYALFSGDINQDGVVDGLDYNDWELDNNNFTAGYFSTDLNGDGIVDGLDFLLWEVNNNNFVGVLTP